MLVLTSAASVRDPMVVPVSIEMTRKSEWSKWSCGSWFWGESLEKMLLLPRQQSCSFFLWLRS